MATSRVLLKSLAVFSIAGYLVISCSSGDGHPTLLPSGSGATGGTGGTDGGKTGGTGGKTGGTGGKLDSGTDAAKDQSTDSPGDGSNDADADAASDGPSDADADAEIDASFCSDGTKDFDESDVDCGGAVCPGCDPGKICAVDGDCASIKCNTTTKKCDPPICTDGVKNGNETDKDCGGANCPKCGDGKVCAAGTDCSSGVCTGNVCQAPTCSDGVTNGTEGDTDCGGSCPSKCSLGQSCKVAADCSSAVCTTNQCKCPTGMVLAPATGGGAYCIDQYEVSYEQYETFWQANPVYSNAECSWNTGVGKYTPNDNWPQLGNKKIPVRNVDWCDAWSYCKWAGKRLCGKQGGGSNAPADYTDASKSQWHNACTAGANSYPYGNTYHAENCIGSDFPFLDAGTPPLPGNRSLNACLGAAPGLYDMSANVAEWEDSCSGSSGASDSCRVRGGSYLPPASAGIACAADRSQLRNAQLPDVGIRCCFP